METFDRLHASQSLGRGDDFETDCELELDCVSVVVYFR